MIGIDGYNFIRADRNANSGKQTGGGIIVYYKNNLDVTAMPELTVCSTSEEVLWVKLQLKQTRPQFVGTVYRPPDGDYESLITCVTNQLSDLNTINCDRMLIGDLNVDLMKPCEARTKRFLDLYKAQGLTSLIKGVTYHGTANDSCIDHICVN